jgi:thiamine pyrophosphokinase
MPRIVIFANGELPDAAAAVSLVQPSDMIVCADGGTRHALALGLKPQVIVGDLDSMAPVERQSVLALGSRVEQHPHDKNETDLELAIRYAVSRSPSSILIVAGLGRRLDQTIGNIALLSGPELVNLDVRMDDGVEEVFFCREHIEVRGKPGDIVSLIPWGAAVQGVRTKGLRWPLRDETLYADKTRGISNEMQDAIAQVAISAGLLLVVHRRQLRSM